MKVAKEGRKEGDEGKKEERKEEEEGTRNI